MEDRFSERTRIARELHDSLLQGFQGLMFRLQAVRQLLPGRPDAASKSLESALQKRSFTALYDAFAAKQARIEGPCSRPQQGERQAHGRGDYQGQIESVCKSDDDDLNRRPGDGCKRRP
jgi:hypothetical protein